MRGRRAAGPAGGPLRATDEPRRLLLGEPERTGGCCGFLTVTVQRCGEIVRCSDWEVPAAGPYAPAPRLPDFHFDADRYDAEVARAENDLAPRTPHLSR